jgi:hypothetical protein
MNDIYDSEPVEEAKKPTEIVKKPRKKRAPSSKTPKKVGPSITPEQFFNSIEPKPEGMKHLLTCRCFLPQFKEMKDPPVHKFVVFSELDEFANTKISYVQCNNCGIIHKIIEVGKSVILKKEATLSIENIEEVSDQLPDWLKGILQKYDCDLPTYQEARFIYHNQLWGRFVVLSKDRADNNIIGKALLILGEKLHKIETFEREE